MTKWQDSLTNRFCIDETLVRLWSVNAAQIADNPGAPLPTHHSIGMVDLPPPLTQPASEVATAFSWSINAAGNLLDAAGCFIAQSLHDAMIAMIDLHWINALSPTPQWNTIPIKEIDAANDLRVFLDIDGSAYFNPFPNA